MAAATMTTIVSYLYMVESKTRIATRFLVIANLLFLLSGQAIADDIAKVLSKRSYPDDKIQLVYRWSVHGRDLICILSSPKGYKYGSDVEEENTQHLVIYDASRAGVAALYKEDIVDGILGINKSGDSMELSVLGGSATHSKVYTLRGNRIEAAFQ